MCGGEGIVDVEVGQRGEGADEPGVQHLFRGELHLFLKGGELFTEVAQVAEQDRLPLLERLDPILGRRATDIIDVLDPVAAERTEDLGVLGHGNEVLVVHRVALVGDDGDLRSVVEEVLQSRDRLLQAIGVDDLPGLYVDGRVDVGTEDHRPSRDNHVIEASHPRPAHRFHAPMPR